MMTPGFWLLAAALAAVASAFLLIPLWRARQRHGHWSLSGVIAGITTVPLAVALYLSVTTWEPDALLDMSGGPAQMVAQLAARLEQNPDDANGWRLLGRSYHALGQYARARQAFQEAWVRTPEPDNDLKLAYAETQVLTDREALRGEAGRLVEEVLAVEPNHPTALWWGGLAALEAGREDLARQRWTRLLAFNQPDDVAEQLRALLAMLPAEGADSSPPAQAAAGAEIRVRVSVAEEMPTQDLGQQASLFLFARVPGERAPVAALRRPAAELPGEFVLSDADAMLPGRSLADFAELTLVARLSASGDASERPGDLYTEARYQAGEQGVTELVIDRIVE